MKTTNFKKINLIFDFDGTLFDSYDAICDCVQRAFLALGIDTDTTDIRNKALHSNVFNAVLQIAKEHNLKLTDDELKNHVNKFDENYDLIHPYPHVEDVLKNEKFNCFVYTHRGSSSEMIIKKYALDKYFIEIVDSTYKFKKKPDKEGISYLLNKYSLDKDRTYYVGDRLLDIECAKNADVLMIFFNSAKLDIDSSNADYVVNDLSEINEIEFK